MPTNHPRLLAVHELFRRYIAVDKGFFGFSWRELIPIRGVFKSMPFGQYSVELSSIAEALEEAASALRGDSSVPEMSAQYVEALLETVRTLNGICQNLTNVSRGSVGSYKYRGYRVDIAEYRRFEKKHRLLGDQLDRHLQ